MPEFLSRPLEWFRGRSNAQKVLIGAGVLLVLIAASPVIQVVAFLVFIVATIAFLIQLARRRPTQVWIIIVLGSLATSVLFGVIEEALFGP